MLVWLSELPLDPTKYHTFLVHCASNTTAAPLPERRGALPVAFAVAQLGVIPQSVGSGAYWLALPFSCARSVIFQPEPPPIQHAPEAIPVAIPVGREPQKLPCRGIEHVYLILGAMAAGLFIAVAGTLFVVQVANRNAKETVGRSDNAPSAVNPQPAIEENPEIENRIAQPAPATVETANEPPAEPQPEPVEKVAEVTAPEPATEAVADSEPVQSAAETKVLAEEKARQKRFLEVEKPKIEAREAMKAAAHAEVARGIAEHDAKVAAKQKMLADRAANLKKFGRPERPPTVAERAKAVMEKRKEKAKK